MLTIQNIKESKTEKQWDRLYNAYIKNYNKLSERLEGNVYDAMSRVEYIDTYANLYIGGIRQNITRTIVSKEAIVSTKKANSASWVLYNMAMQAQSEKTQGMPLSLGQKKVIELFQQFGGSRAKMRNYLRKHPEYMDFLSKATQELGTSWTEYIPSP